MADDLMDTLVRFHREIVVPDTQRIVKAELQPLREEFAAHDIGPGDRSTWLFP